MRRLAWAILVGLALAPAAAARPGPPLLYAPAAPAPQLENRGVWKARPILVSGATAYRRGEFLYQDFLYDDHGGRFEPDPADARLKNQPFSLNNGTLTYPTDPKYANDAADLVELRVKPLKRATAFRITFNSMLDPKLVAVTLLLGDGPVKPLPLGAGASAPAARIATVYAGGVEGVPGSVKVDQYRRQFDVRIPHSAWNPGRRTVRLAAATGVWDGKRYAQPQASADATHPGGGGSALFNVAFRKAEPLPDIRSVFNIVADPAWWRDSAQGDALAAGDLSPFFAKVDFAKLASKRTDNAGVPKTGSLDRILPSHYETRQGADPTVSCGDEECTGPYLGRLQPYAIYVPRKPRPAKGYGFTLLMHALFTNYNMYAGSFNQSQLGDRGRGSIVVTPEARGPDGGYQSYALADVFDVWNDVRRRYSLDPRWTAITGYSMGAIGTFQIAEQYPDLFGAAESTAGTDSTGATASLRHVPMLMWNMAADEEVTADKWTATAQRLDDLGFRYELDVFAPGEHNTFAVEDSWGPVAKFLGERRVPRNPRHISFAPLDSFLGRSDHAYWLSDIRRAKDGPATVEAITDGRGGGEPPVSDTQRGADILTGGHFPFPALGYTRQYRTWGKPPAAPRRDHLTITTENIASLTVDPKRAGVTCAAEVDATATVILKGCRSR